MLHTSPPPARCLALPAVALALALGTAVLGARQAPIPRAPAAPDSKEHKLTPGTYARFATTEGDFAVRLFDDRTPLTVANFTGLAEGTKDPATGKPGQAKPFYDGLVFHRIIEGFMIQGGDPAGNGTGGPGYTIKAEFNDVKHVKGILSMARTRDPNSAGSQFFVMAAPATHLDGQYSAFGKVVEGLDVIDKIVNVPSGEMDRPTEKVEMKVRIEYGK
jgi:cyclophilin family peptidyl-prolyl cis-trans isomerase